MHYGIWEQFQTNTPRYTYTHTYARKHWDAYVIVMLINTETQALGQDWDPPNPPILAYDLLSLAHLQNIEFHKYFCMSKTMS